MPIKTFQAEPPTLNLTPMIDVLFLLIIFFMVATKFTDVERKIKLELPEVSNAGTLSAAPEKKIVNVYHDGSITIDRKIVTIDELTEHLRAARRQFQDLGVLIRGDADGRFQSVASVLAACRQAGIHQMGISVQSDKKPLPHP